VTLLWSDLFEHDADALKSDFVPPWAGLCRSYADRVKTLTAAETGFAPRQGTRCVKLTANNSDTNTGPWSGNTAIGTRPPTNNCRCQLEPGDKQPWGEAGSTTYYSSSIRIPDGQLPAPPHFGLAMQFHGAPFSASPCLALNIAAYDAPANTFSLGNSVSNPNQRLWVDSGTIKRNVWYDFTFLVHWSGGSDGYVEFWKNGVPQQLSATRAGTLSSGGLRWNGPTLKGDQLFAGGGASFYGATNYRGVNSVPGDVTYYFDAVRIGTTLADVQSVTPTGGPMRVISTGAEDRQVDPRVRTSSDGKQVVVGPADQPAYSENPRMAFTMAEAVKVADQMKALAAQAPAPTPTPTPTPAPSSGMPKPTGTKLFTGVKETDWPTQSSAGPDRITDVPDPLGKLSGTVMKFTVHDGDTVISPNPRAQLETAYIIRPGDEIWWGGKILLPSDFPNVASSGWVSLASCYGPPFAGASPAPLQIVKGAHDAEPTLGLVSQDWQRRYWGVPVSQAKGRWVEYLVHEHFAMAGWMEVWADGKQVMPKTTLPLISSANSGGANRLSNTFYRQKGMWTQPVTMYHAQTGLWRV
jgi:hypothetical protein